MVHFTRRHFVASAISKTALAALPSAGLDQFLNAPRHGQPGTLQERYEKLDAILRKPLFKRDLFPDPVIIESVELLTRDKQYICRVRSRDGHEGISVSNSQQMEVLYPLFVKRFAPFFTGKDARDIESLISAALVYENNYKAQSLAIWVPIATIEFAILDMFGKIANLPMGMLISDKIYNKEISVYQANGERDNPAEEVIEHLKHAVAVSHAKAIKFKLGGRMSHTEYPPHRSEKLIPMVRETFGDQMIISADANGSYTVQEALRIGKIMQGYKYAFFEEPVQFDWYEETRQVADALEIPVAGGEQEPSMHNFRWLIGNGGLSIVQPDVFYFGGMMRCMRVALMANAFGKQCIPHISSTGLGYVYMMHFVSCIPNSGPYHEFKEFNNVLPYHCATSTLRTDKDGKVALPSGPGFGVEIDPDFLKKCGLVRA
jgi:L-alanine-DL-glutamate epimerase-like enolase superfamily enzyme